MAWTRRRMLLATGAAALTACAQSAPRPGDALAPLYANPARNEWPEAFLQQPAEVQAMYRYAAANREALHYIPCFCGCVSGGHQNNFDCYVREVMGDGRIRLDTMSFG